MRYLLAAIICLGLIPIPATSADVPRAAPQFTVSLTTGQKLLLSRFRGKVVALEFLLTTCPHCSQTSAEMEKISKEPGFSDFQPLGVAINAGAMSLVPAYIKKLNLTFPVGVGTRDPVYEFLQHSPNERMMAPQLVLIDRQGVIRAQFSGDSPFFLNSEENLRILLKALLEEPTDQK